MTELPRLREQLRAVKAEMREKGIRRISCFNGGHTPESMRLNQECFRLETLIKKLKETPCSSISS